MSDKVLNVVYASDDNYFLLLLTSIESLIENNKSFDKINFYLFSDRMNGRNLAVMKACIEKHGHTFQHMDIHCLLKEYNLEGVDTYSASTYSRVFIERLIPYDCEKVLYIDADTIIQKDLNELWSIDMCGYTLIGKSEDNAFLLERSKALNFKYTKYINAGIILINFRRWKEIKAEEKLLHGFAARDRKYSFPDQDVISMVLTDEICDTMPAKFNQFFDRRTYKDAVILHYGGFVARGNPRAFKALYNKYLKNTELGTQKYLLKPRLKRKIKDKIWISMKCGYLPMGDVIYSFILKIFR